MDLIGTLEGIRKSLRGRNPPTATKPGRSSSSTHEVEQNHCLVAKGDGCGAKLGSSSSVNSFQNMSKNLLNTLECPVCFEYMTPPITLCENGHNICQHCKPRLVNCPTCRYPLIGIRNVTLENIAREVNFPCPNAEYGCNISCQLGELGVHVPICSYHIYDCVLSKIDNCKWQGKRSRMREHVVRHHGTKVFSAGSLITDRCMQFEVSNAECFSDCCNVIFAFDEFFIFIRKFDVPNKKLCMAVQCVGTKDNASKFQYKFKMYKNNGDQSNTVSSKTHSDSEVVDKLFCNNECVTVDFDLLMGFMKGRKLVQLRKIAVTK